MAKKKTPITPTPAPTSIDQAVQPAQSDALAVPLPIEPKLDKKPDVEPTVGVSSHPVGKMSDLTRLIDVLGDIGARYTFLQDTAYINTGINYAVSHKKGCSTIKFDPKDSHLQPFYMEFDAQGMLVKDNGFE